MAISKKDILDRVTTYDILNHYLQPYHKFGSQLKRGQNINNPLLTAKQETPSFNIYKSSSAGTWRYNDFATGDSGSCFDLVMKLFGCSFLEALQKIATDLNIVTDSPVVLAPITKPQPPKQVNAGYGTSARLFTEAELFFWGIYGITTDVLRKFKVEALSEFTTLSKMRKPYTVKSSTDKFIFAYNYGTGLKLYKPLDEKKYRFLFLGNKPEDFCFGWEQLPPTGEFVFLTGGEKDVITLAAHGYSAFTLNSETANLSAERVTELKRRFQHLLLLYDSDNTGKKQATTLSQQFNLQVIDLPPIPNNGKDISDFFKEGGSTTTINELINKALKNKRNNYTNLHYDTLENMIEKCKNTPPVPFLWSGIKTGSFGFIFGPAKSGKTIFCECLAMSIAAGAETYFNIPISGGRQKVLFISLEEFWQPRTERNMLQAQYLNCSLGDWYVISNESFPSHIDSREQWEQLKQLIILAGVNVVFIDSLSRLYSGKIEESNVAKEVSVRLRDMTNELKITLIVIHHTPKQNGKPITLGSLAGSRILGQDADFTIAINKAPDSTRYMKTVAFRYAQENDETVTTFTMNESLWVIPGMQVPEMTILNTLDGRNDETNTNLIFNLIADKTNSPVGFATTDDLLSALLGSGRIGRATIFNQIKKLIRLGKISSPVKGMYKSI